MKTGAIILGAGKGTRINSDLPKVLHCIMNKPLIEYVRENVEPLIDTKPVVVIGHEGEKVQDYFKDSVSYAWQRQQLGTGDAVKWSLKEIGDEGTVFVLCGDTPLLQKETLEKMKEEHLAENRSATVLTAILEDSTGYGRICKEETGSFSRIVEEKDATLEERTIKEVNSGTYLFERSALEKALLALDTDNAQGEFYLTDVLEIMKSEGRNVGVYTLDDETEIKGINNRVQLAEAAKMLRDHINYIWMEKGVTLEDPNTAYIGSQVILDRDVIIGANVHLEGKTRIGKNTIVGNNSTIEDCKIGEGTNIRESILLDSKIGNGCLIGPFAYIRPGSHLGDCVKVGDFVELKKTKVGNGSKIPHHSYIGDSKVGEKVNIGAGTITCNYDGECKYETIVEDGAFIGSNTNLVAPVVIGKAAYVGAGSTITKDVPSRSLSIARGIQKNIEDWNKK